MRCVTLRSLASLLALIAFLLLQDGLEAARPLGDRVTIRRDTFGVPHILAQDEEAAGYGFGFAQAEDHAAEMGRRFLVGRGNAAQYFGAPALAGDLAMQRLRNREEAARAVRTLGRGFRKWLRGFVAGYNHYVEVNRAQLPPWVPLVDEADVLAYGRSGSVTSALRPPRELLQKYPGSDRQPATGEGIVFTGQSVPLDDVGSNAFALAGTKTTSGKPILLGNPHLTWSSRYWEAHVTIPGKLDFYGSTLVGIPVLRAGFNDRLAYVQTNNNPDLQDLYALPLDPAQPDHYLFDGKSRALQRVTAAVQVRQDDGGLSTETREYWASHLGPIVHRTTTHVFAVRAIALESWRYQEGFYELWFSRSLKDFRRGLAKRLHYFSNFTYADADGNIFYQWNARLPRRRELRDYSLDVPGEPRVLWKGLYDIDDLPHLLNPPGGYIQNANNAPWWTSLRDRLDPAKYPAYVEQAPLALRPQVVLDELERRDRLSPDDVLAVKFTTRMLAAERVVPDLLRAVDANDAAPAEARAGAEVLRTWDRQVAKASRGAVLFQRFWDVYREGRPQPFADDFDPARPLETPRGLADPAAATEALARATRETRDTFGAADVAWGDVHRFRFDALDLPADGAPGVYGTYRVVTFEPQPDNRRIAGRVSDAQPLVGVGDAWVLMVHFTRPLQAWSVLAYGQTTRAGSPHVSDQIGFFADHKLRPAYYTKADIETHTEREYRP